MAIMKFNSRVKYKEAYHNGLEPFEVDEADVAELQKAGGVLIVEPKGEPEPEKPEEAPEPEKPEDVPKPKGRKKSAGD